MNTGTCIIKQAVHVCVGLSVGLLICSAAHGSGRPNEALSHSRQTVAVQVVESYRTTSGEPVVPMLRLKEVAAGLFDAAGFQTVFLIPGVDGTTIRSEEIPDQYAGIVRITSTGTARGAMYEIYDFGTFKGTRWLWTGCRWKLRVDAAFRVGKRTAADYIDIDNPAPVRTRVPESWLTFMEDS